MHKPLLYKHQVVVKADRAAVWDALINPELTKLYMYGCIPETDWQIGSPLIWKGAVDGIEYVIGNVVAFEPISRLVTTTFSPHEGFEDVPSNYLQSEYMLSSENGETILDITQGDFRQVENGEARYQEAGAAWEVALQGLKKILEG